MDLESRVEKLEEQLQGIQMDLKYVRVILGQLIKHFGKEIANERQEHSSSTNGKGTSD